MRRYLTIIAFTAVLASCGPLIDLPGGDAPEALFDLIVPNARVGAVEGGATVMLEDLEVPGALRTDRILVRTDRQAISYLAGAAWSDRTANLVRDYLTEGVTGWDGFVIVSARLADIPGDYRLRLYLRDFGVHVDEGGSTGVARVRLDAILLRNGPSEVISRRILAAEERVPLDQGSSLFAQGLNTALDDVAEELAAWIRSNIEPDAQE